MKEGAGTDPFDVDGDVQDEDEQDQTDDEGDLVGGENYHDDGFVESSDADRSEALDDLEEDDNSTTNPGDVGLDPRYTGQIIPEIPQSTAADSGVPWVYTRSNVKQDRDMVQFFLRAFVQEAEGDFVDAVADELGASVSKTDVREAAYVAAMRQPEIVAEELERWGFEGE